MTSSDHRVRFGIIGFGRFAEKAIAPAFRECPAVELVALQKRSLTAAREKAALWGVPLAFDSAEALARHPSVDAVFIVSANSTHCPETLAAADAGKHVLVEKPMAMNAREAERMIETCERKRVKLMVGHMVRLSPLVRRVREVVASGTLGRIVYARADFIYDARMSQRHWLRDRAVAGGGPIFDVGVHCIDTLRYVLDDEVASITGQLSPPPTATATEEVAELALKFTRGTVGAVLCSYRAAFRRRFIEVIGEEGIVQAPEFTATGLTLPLTTTLGRDDRPTETKVEQIPVPDLYVEEIRHFAECILHDKEPELSGWNGLQNQKLLDQVMPGG